jgi:methionyl-tRNA formyltransferase
MGTASFTVPSLELLVLGPHRVVAVYTQPPRPAGRGQRARMTPMHEAALRLGLPVRTPATLRTAESLAELAALEADLAVVGAYGLILPPAILAAPRLGCINLHASLLPRWRGAAPIQRAILAGDRESGLSIFRMEEGLDTGPVLAMRSLPIGPRTTADELHDGLAALAVEMLPDVLAGLKAGTLRATPQPAEGVTYATKIRKEEGRLDLSRPALELDRQIRALSPTPGCFCEIRGERLILLEAEPVDAAGAPGSVIALPLTIACGTGALRVLRVQRAGRKPMAAAELQRGFAIPVGTRLG